MTQTPSELLWEEKLIYQFGPLKHTIPITEEDAELQNRIFPEGILHIKSSTLAGYISSLLTRTREEAIQEGYDRGRQRHLQQDFKDNGLEAKYVEKQRQEAVEEERKRIIKTLDATIEIARIRESKTSLHSN